MKYKPSLRSFLLFAAASHLVTSAAQAATFYWDNSGGTTNSWGHFLNWSTSATTANVNGPNPSPTASDVAFFNVSTLITAQTVNLNNDRAILGIIFNNANTTDITANASGTTNRTLTLGNDGITINSGAGAVTLGNGATNGEVLLSLTAGAQTWTNLSANNLTINNTAATFTRASGTTLTFNQIGAGGFSIGTTVLPNDATGIVGPWSLFGTGTSQQYAFNNAGTIAAYTGGTAAADAEAFTSDTTNYDFSATGTTTLTTDRTAHTARYTGTGNTIDLGASGANTLTLNGLLAVGSSGSVTIQRSGSSTGTLVAGSTNDLLIAGSQNVSITAPISGAGALTYAGSGTLTLSGANTYSGATTVGSGTLFINGSSIIPTSTLVTIGNAPATTFLIDNDTTIGTLSGLGSLGTVALQGNTLTFGNATATTYNGQFTGTSGSGIIKQGNGGLTLGGVTSIPGTLTLSGGVTTVTQGKLSGGTVTLNANNVALSMIGGTVTGTSGLPESTISNLIVLGGSVTTTGASVFTAGAGKWNFAGDITGADGVNQTLKFDSRAGGSNGGDRTSTLFSGVIADGASGGTLNLSFNITPQSASNASNNHPTNASLSGVNTFTGSITATRANGGATSWLTIGGERWTSGIFGQNTPTYGREGTGYLGGNNGGNYAGAINFGSGSALVNLNYFSSANQTWSGVIGGGGNSSGALVKEGSGTLTLTNANLYSSLTTIGGGTLALGFDTTTTDILPATTPLHMGLGTVYDPIPANADIIISGGGGGGTLLLGGAAASATQTVASLNISTNTANKIVVDADRTLTITSPTITIGANSALNFNTAAGGNNGATVGSSVVEFGGAPSAFTTGFTVTDVGGFGLATVNGSHQVIRDTSTAALPTFDSSSATNYLTTSSSGNSVTASQSAASITTDTTGGNVTLTLDPGVTLSANVWNFGGAGPNTAQVTGGDGVNSVASGNTISINNFNTGAVTFNTPILANGANALVVGGTGTVALTGVNTYTGATTINSGTLQVSGSGSLNSGTYAVAIAINGGSKLQYSSSATQTLSGVISGPGGLTKDTDDSSVLTLSATNIYTGPTTVNAGTLRAGAAGGGQAFGGGSAVTLADNAGVTLNLNNFNQTIGSLAGGGSTGGDVTLGTATLTTGGNNFSTTFGGVISSSSGGLTKNGSGTMTLSGANTYGGATIINGGTLALGAANVLPDSSAVTIGAATLNAATFADTVGTLDVTSTAVINLGSGAALAFADSSAVDWTGGTLNITGTLGATSLRFGTTSGGLNPGQLALISVNNTGLGTYTLDTNGYLVAGGGGGSAYDTWAAVNAPIGGPDDDDDGDGVSNAVEFVLGGLATTNDLDLLPVPNASGANLTFTFQRDVSSIDPKTALFIETSTDLVTWNTAPSPYTVPDGAVANNPGVTVVEDTPPGFDTVTLTVPKGLDAKKFARLKVVITP